MSLAISFASFSAYAFTLPFDPMDGAAGEDPTYLAGKKALDEQRWRDAIREFDKIIDTRSNRADGAYYWKAYALNKMHHGPEANSVCAVLHAKYPKSDWNNDCTALNIEAMGPIRVFNASDKPNNGTTMVRISPGETYTVVREPWGGYDGDRSSDPEADMKLLALNSLLRDNPDRALPQLRSLLSGNSSLALKKHAILVLAQSKNPEAQKILDDAIRGKMDPQLQREAILMSGIYHRTSSPAMVDIYKTTNDPKVKHSVIQALFITRDAGKLVEIARSEKDLELKRQIVSQLAIMHDKAAQDYMLEILK